MRKQAAALVVRGETKTLILFKRWTRYKFGAALKRTPPQSESTKSPFFHQAAQMCLIAAALRLFISRAPPELVLPLFLTILSEHTRLVLGVAAKKHNHLKIGQYIRSNTTTLPGAKFQCWESASVICRLKKVCLARPLAFSLSISQPKVFAPDP